MQKKDVRNSFIFETFFLTLFSCVAGTLLSFAAMWGISLIKINAGGNPLGMLLVNGHLTFVPTLTGILGYNLLILFIAAVTAYFPARKAASLSAAEALRHFE
jgi:ABC-type antimicrobial peptide transport system permease subunit